METERIALSQREGDRLRVLSEVQQRHLTQVEAAQQIKLSDRQVRRLLLRLGEQGSRLLADPSLWTITSQEFRAAQPADFLALHSAPLPPTD